MTAASIRSLATEGAVVFMPQRFGDTRGWTGEIISARMIVDMLPGITFHAVQENQSVSHQPGVVRGLHFQRPPFTQARIVRIASGAVLSVMLDLRAGQRSFEQCESIHQSLAGGECLYVPAGCAHGIVALETSTVLNWSSDTPFDAASADGVLFSDPALGLTWPLTEGTEQVSARDLGLPTLAAQPFRFDLSGRGPAT